jgi:general secretion pathway protein J
MRRGNGFTLLEVLIAMSIFSVIGLGAAQMLRSMIQTHERTQARIEAFNSVSQALALLERDLTQIVSRPIRDEYGESRPSLLVGNDAYPLEFTRTGWSNPLNFPRSDLQRVAYARSDDGELVRYFWLVLDRAEDSSPKSQVLLAGIRDLRVNLVDDQGAQTDFWPNTAEPGGLPAAIEIILETEKMGEVRRLVPLINTAFISVPGQNQNPSNNTDSNETDSNDSESNDSDSKESDADETEKDEAGDGSSDDDARDTEQLRENQDSEDDAIETEDIPRDIDP